MAGNNVDLKYAVTLSNADSVKYLEGLGFAHDDAVVLALQSESDLAEFFALTDPGTVRDVLDRWKQDLYWMNHPDEAAAYAASQRGMQVAMREAEVAKGQDLDRRRKADPELAKRVNPDGSLTEYGIAMQRKEIAIAKFKKHLPIYLLVGAVGVGAVVLIRRRRRG